MVYLFESIYSCINAIETLPCFDLLDIIKKHNIFTAEIIALLKKEKLKILPTFHQYLKNGYYPYAKEMNLQQYYLTREQNLHITLESDLIAIHQELSGKSIRKIKQLMVFIASCVPFIPNWKKIKSAVGINDIGTVKKYFDLLEKAGLILYIGKSTTKFSLLEVQEKVYLNNPSLYYALSLKSRTPNKGGLRENFFAAMLMKDYTIASAKKLTLL